MGPTVLGFQRARKDRELVAGFLGAVVLPSLRGGRSSVWSIYFAAADSRIFSGLGKIASLLLLLGPLKNWTVSLARLWKVSGCVILILSFEVPVIFLIFGKGYLVSEKNLVLGRALEY